MTRGINVFFLAVGCQLYISLFVPAFVCRPWGLQQYNDSITDPKPNDSAGTSHQHGG